MHPDPPPAANPPIAHPKISTFLQDSQQSNVADVKSQQKWVYLHRCLAQPLPMSSLQMLTFTTALLFLTAGPMAC